MICRRILLLSLVIFTAVKIRETDGTCVLYGVCHESASGRQHSCLYQNGAPIKIPHNETVYKVLADICPMLLEHANTTGLCCNGDQLIYLNSLYSQAAAIFKRCPACMFNLAQEMCQNACSPYQSQFSLVTGFAVDDITLKRYVTEVTVYLSSEFMDSTFESCAHLALPSAGKLAMDAACGHYTAATCNADRWFQFQGNPTLNPTVAFQVNFKRQDTPFLDFVPFNPKTYKCTEAPTNSSAPCSCVDCPQSCPALPKYDLDDTPLHIFGIDIYALIAAIGFIIFLISFSVTVYCCSNRKSRMGSSQLDLTEDEEERETPIRWYHTLSESFAHYMESSFAFWGQSVASHPTLVLAIASWIVFSLSYGAVFLIVTTDPVQLWAAPLSQSRLEKDYFDSTFGPFYRSEQMFFTARGLKNIYHPTAEGTVEFGPVFNEEFLLKIFELQQRIEKIPGWVDVCFAPMSLTKTPRTSRECTVESVWGYFQNDINVFKKTSVVNNYTVGYLDILHKCLQNNLNPDCLAPYGGNVETKLAVGGFLQYGKTAFEKSNAIIVTYINANHLNDTELLPVLEWETNFIEVVKNWSVHEMPDYMDIAFRSERSIQDELQRESDTEIYTVVISYILMFTYISFALGSYSWDKTFFVNTKIMLGLGGVGVVLLSVLSTIGVFGYLGIPTTLLTIEVIPFLVLAVGVDNMFILVKSFEDSSSYTADPIARIGEALGNVGPSIVLTTFSEATCFAIGGWTDMPAVKTFANYATMALLINFGLQMTVFVAFLSLDARRAKGNRVDVLCCMTVKVKTKQIKQEDSWVGKQIKNIVVPSIFKRGVAEGIIIIFVCWTFVSTAVISRVEPGLEQKLSVPEDSYVLKYFEVLEDYFSMGAPVYFVLKSGLNFSRSEVQNAVCGGLRCHTDSLSTQIFSASQEESASFIATGASSWLDDFNDWSSVAGCCKIYPNGSFCPHNSGDQNCSYCPIELNEDQTRPTWTAFKKYLPFFLLDNPDVSCSKGGHAAYGGGVNYQLDNNEEPIVTDSYFMAYHSAMRTSRDYYTGLKMAREIASNITRMLKSTLPDDVANVEVFPYSVFYVFYEQYLTIWKDGELALSLSLVSIFVVTFIFNGFDLGVALIILCTVTMALVDLIALMYWWGINLNAISLVNLVVAVGISVEFCSHIAHSFILSSCKTKKLRAAEALATTGSAVFSGITCTKFIGIGVLAFSRTQIFRVFYFRMYLGMVLFGAAHGLIFLPVMLGFVGSDNKAVLFLRSKRRNNN